MSQVTIQDKLHVFALNQIFFFDYISGGLIKLAKVFIKISLISKHIKSLIMSYIFDYLYLNTFKNNIHENLWTFSFSYFKFFSTHTCNMILFFVSNVFS